MLSKPLDIFANKCISKQGLRVASYWGLGGAITLTGCFASTFSGNYALAQITPDATLGAASSVVTPNININGGNADRIDGGATRGINLFHSFIQFNVRNGQRVYFNNPAGIENIFSRVTGTDPSDILGTLGVNGRANLFLLNPNGIIFGPNARLDVGGSFVATTANAIQFGNQGFFSATQPETPPLLTIKPSAFFFNQLATQPITSQARLQVPKGQSLLLLGGNVVIDGGRLNAPDGQVELAGVAGSGTVELTVDGSKLGLGLLDNIARADVSVTNRANVNVNGENGGLIQVQGSRVTFGDDSNILADTEGKGNGQGILIQASQFIVRDGAQASASALEISQGNSGGITVNALESVELFGTSRGGTSGGNERPSKLASDARGPGKAGDMRINTGRLILRDGAKISSSTIDRPGGGNITVNASESVEVIGTSSNQRRSSGLSVQTRGVGKAGDLTIYTRRLIVRDGGEVSASTFGTGDGGDIEVNATESVEVIGTSRNGELTSRIVADTGRPLDSADAGILIGTGDGGDLDITTGRLIVQDGAEVSVSGLSSGQNPGDAGKLTVTANSIELDEKGKITATTASGQGGNIELQVQELLLLRHNSQISTSAGNAQAGGDGGNLTINNGNSGFIVAVPKEDSDITANAYTGRGGNINITTQGIYGLEFRPIPTPLSDITASSQFGVNGVVQIITPGVDITRGLAELPNNVVDASSLIDRRCADAGIGKERSSFTITGRGGIPPSPNDPLHSELVITNWVTVDSEVETNTAPVPTTPRSSTPNQLVEAQGWIINELGQVVLTASAPTVTPSGDWFPEAECNTASVESQ